MYLETKMPTRCIVCGNAVGPQTQRLVMNEVVHLKCSAVSVLATRMKAMNLGDMLVAQYNARLEKARRLDSKLWHKNHGRYQ